jgi:hypothetical protein
MARPTTPRDAKRYCLIALLVLSVFCGLMDPFVVEESQVERVLACLVGLLAVALMLLWCLYDGQERSYRLGLALRILIVAMAFIGVPFYLLRTRGFRGILSIGWMLLFLGACVLAMGLAAAAMWAVVG